MSSIEEIKQSVDVKLDKLDARADAFQAALGGSESQMNERIERRKQELRQTIEKLSSDIDQEKDLPHERKQAVGSLVDNLNQQIASSQTAAHETLAYARRQIQEGLRKMETEVDTALAESKSTPTEPLRLSIGAYARAMHRLDVELEAAEARFASAKDKGDLASDQRRQEMAEEIAQLKQRLGEKKAHSGDKLARFEAELHEKFEQMTKKFTELFR
jgi:archaellum component FlaC